MIFRGTIAALISTLALVSSPSADDAVADESGGDAAYTRGWLELARVQPVDLLMRAKLDSGALTSALHADILHGPERRGYPSRLGEDVAIDVPADADDGAETIVFALESRRGKRVVFEREIVRWVRIKDRDGGSTSRPVVHMAFCVGGVFMEGDVGLTDRGDFNYPLLVGRRMLTKANVMVASWETFTHESRCYEDGPRPNDD